MEKVYLKLKVYIVYDQHSDLHRYVLRSIYSSHEKAEDKIRSVVSKLEPADTNGSWYRLADKNGVLVGALHINSEGKKDRMFLIAEHEVDPRD